MPLVSIPFPFLFPSKAQRWCSSPCRGCVVDRCRNYKDREFRILPVLFLKGGFPKRVAHPTVLGYKFKAQYKLQKTGNHPSKDSQDKRALTLVVRALRLELKRPACRPPIYHNPVFRVHLELAAGWYSHLRGKPVEQPDKGLDNS